MYTDNPCADAEAHFDALFEAGEAHDAQQATEVHRLSRAFIDAAEWGADEPLEKSDVAEALYEVQCTRPELFDALFYLAAAQKGNPVLCSMVSDIASAWAGIKTAEAA